MELSRIFAIICFMSAAIIYPGYAEVYKWKDAEGNLRYGDFPPSADIKYEVLNKKKTQSLVNKVGDGQPKNALMNDLNADINKEINQQKQSKQTTHAEKLKIEAEKLASENSLIEAENCQIAKSNLATYRNGGRIKRVNEKGEVAFLNDADIASAAITAKKDVEQYCNASQNLVGR